MARKPSEIRELAKRLAALESEVEQLKAAMTPRERLRRAVERTRQRVTHVPLRELNRAIGAAVREVRRDRSAG